MRAWAEGWWDMSTSVGDEIAPLFGAAAGTVTMLPSVTLASAVFLSSVRLEPRRNRIVLLEGEFPSIRYLFETLAPRFGGEVVVVPSPGGDGLAADEERIRAAIDEIRASGAWERWRSQPAIVT